MPTYTNCLTSCKLSELPTLEICGTIKTRTEIAKALHGDVNGEWINIRGPGHSPNDRSLGIKFDKNAPDGFIVNSFPGDDWRVCRSYVKALLCKVGQWPPPLHLSTEGHDADLTSDTTHARDSKYALEIWSASVPANGTPAEGYLRCRGIVCPIPSSMRFNPHLKHRSGQTFPAMVALVTKGTDGKPIGILRTFLAQDGKGKAPVPDPKMMLGPCGGGAVRLGDANHSLMIGEGIETCLSVMQETGRPAWAALSTSGIRRLHLPKKITEVTILADGDKPGEKAALCAATRWRNEVRSVRIARPPQGTDFNDLLRKHSQPEGAA